MKPSYFDLSVRILDAGGRVVEPRMAIAGIGWYATCAEPGGLCFELVEADLRAR